MYVPAYNTYKHFLLNAVVAMLAHNSPMYTIRSRPRNNISLLYNIYFPVPGGGVRKFEDPLVGMYRSARCT